MTTLASDRLLEIGGVTVACVAAPIFTCLIARLSVSTLPQTKRAQLFLYGTMASLFTPFTFIATLLACVLDKLKLYRSDTSLWDVVAMSIWVGVTCWAPYLYLCHRQEPKAEPRTD